MDSPDQRWVSKQTFLELWESHQKALTELSELRSALNESERLKSFFVSECLRIGNQAKSHCDRADALDKCVTEIERIIKGDKKDE
jgi:hypothetical protein